MTHLINSKQIIVVKRAECSENIGKYFRKGSDISIHIVYLIPQNVRNVHMNITHTMYIVQIMFVMIETVGISNFKIDLYMKIESSLLYCVYFLWSMQYLLPLLSWPLLRSRY
jgi:hypothetical protein